MTEKLYYLDSHMQTFTAVVRSCQAGKPVRQYDYESAPTSVLES